MTGNVGLWIDHRHAVIVSVKDGGETTRHVLSHLEKHVRFSSPTQDPAAEDQRDRRFIGHLYKYYDKVVACLRDADAILILGPGEAKGELKARLEHESLGDRIAGCNPADKMTDGQVAAAVRSHFGPQTVRSGRSLSPATAHAPLTLEG